MKLSYQRVVVLIGVSSKAKSKSLSIFFVVAFFASTIFFPYSKKSIASEVFDINVSEVVSLTNKSREKNNVAIVSVNQKLSQAAEMKASDMLANNYFSHNSPNGKTPWFWIGESGYDYKYAGENLAMDFHSAEKMEEAWMASPTHRANILNEKYKEIGVAVKEGNLNGRSTILVVVMFGSGDRNIFSAIDKKENYFNDLEVSINEEKKIPILPGGEKRRNIFETPAFVTSLQSDTVISKNEIEIYGRAKAQEEIAVFDNEKLVAKVVADEDGWFRVKEENLESGKHKLFLESKKIITIGKTEFFVDQEKPKIDFQLLTDQKDSEKYILKVKANKENCFFNMNGEARMVAGSKEAFFSIDSKKSSVILRVRDSAGNKNYKQVNMVNYYSSKHSNKVSEKMASLIVVPENIFAIDSGREEVKKNMGFASRQLFASNIGD